MVTEKEEQQRLGQEEHKHQIQQLKSHLTDLETQLHDAKVGAQRVAAQKDAQIQQLELAFEEVKHNHSDQLARYSAENE